MDYLMNEFAPIIEHVKANPVAYGIGAVIACIVIFFTRPYSISIIFYSIEVSIYLFSMHTVMYVLVYLTAGFSNQTSMKNVFEDNARGEAAWTTPWLHFWQRDVYDPSWILWLEVVLAIIVICLVRYYRPMKVQTKFKGQMAPDHTKEKPKKTKGKDDDDDDWGVATTRRYTMPEDFGKNLGKK